MKPDFMQTLEKRVQFNGTDAVMLRAMSAWFKTQDLDHKVAALMMMTCVCEELESNDKGASTFLFNLVASLYRVHHRVYKVNTLTLKDIFDQAWAAAELEVKPAINKQPS